MRLANKFNSMGARRINPAVITLPSYEYITTGDFDLGSTSGPTGVSYGTEDPTRQLLLLHAGRYDSEPGTVNQAFTSPFTTAYRFSARAPNGLYLPTDFISYDNRDATMLTEIYPTGTSGDLLMTHGTGLTYGTNVFFGGNLGQYWLFSVYDLNTTTGPYSLTSTTSNSPTVTIPYGGILTVLVSNNNSGMTLSVGTHRGTYTSYDYLWGVWDYQNLTGSSENKTLTVGSSTGNLRIIATVWR
jgi:hypothetical protein